MRKIPLKGGEPHVGAHKLVVLGRSHPDCAVFLDNLDVLLHRMGLAGAILHCRSNSRRHQGYVTLDEMGQGIREDG